MNISREEKYRYLREAEVVLAREGFLTDRTHAGGLRVLLDGAPLCEVPESGVLIKLRPCRSILHGLFLCRFRVLLPDALHNVRQTLLDLLLHLLIGLFPLIR